MSIYWPGMNADMKDYISRCERCRNFEISNQKETLMPHELPSRPWEKVGADLFSLDGRDYLITVDYLSNFWEVDRYKVFNCHTQAESTLREEWQS